MKDFFDRLRPWRAVGLVAHVRLHHLPPALHHRVRRLLRQARWIVTLQIGEQRQALAEDRIVADAEAMERFDHLRPDLVVLLLVDRLAARRELHDKSEAYHKASSRPQRTRCAASASLVSRSASSDESGRRMAPVTYNESKRLSCAMREVMAPSR